MPEEDERCRFCARQGHRTPLVPIYVVSTHPVRLYWACHQCLTELEDPAAGSASA